jgi:PAS domain S-box-containing protein
MLFAKKLAGLDEKLLLDLLDHSAEGIIIASGAFPKILYANLTFQKIFGYTVKELLKFSPAQIMSMIHPDDKEAFFTRYKRRMAGLDIPSRQKVRGIDKDKKVHWIEYSSHRIMFNGEYAIQITFLDTSKYHELLEIQQNAYTERNKILENVNESIIILDKHFKINWVNKAFEKLSFLKRDDILNETVTKLFLLYILPSYRITLLNMTKDVLLGKDISNQELMINYNDRLLTISVNIGHVKDDQDRIKYIICSIKDITNDKKNIDSLSDRISLIDSIMPATHYGLLVVDDHKVVFVNKTFLEIWKVPKKYYKTTDDEKLLSHAMGELSNPDEFINSVKHIYANPSEVSQEYINFKDGRVYERTSHPHIRNGKVIGIVWSFYDITSRINLEKQIKDSEQRFRGAFEYSSIGMSLVSPDGQWIKVNKTLCDMLEYTEAELLAGTYKKVTYPDDLQATIDLTNSLLSGEKDFGSLEKRYYSKSGKIIWVFINVTAIRDQRKKVLYFVTQTRDITEAHNIQVAKDELTQKYELVTGISGQLFYEYEIDTGIIKWTGPIAQVVGYDEKEFDRIGIKGWSDLIHPDDRKRVNEILNKAQNEIGKFNCEYRFKHKNGSHVHMYDEGLFFKDKISKKVRMLGSMRDITLLKNAQGEILRRENIFKKVVTNTPIVTFVIDKKGNFVLSEGKGLKNLSLKPGQVIGQSAYMIYKDFPDVINCIKKALSGESISYTHKIGKLSFSTYYTPLRSDDKEIEGLIGVATDITDLKNTEDILLKARAQDEALLKAIPDGIIAIDQLEKVVFANNAAYEKLRLSEPEFIGKTINSLFKLTVSNGQILPKDLDPLFLAQKIKNKVIKTIKDDIFLTDSKGNTFPVYISANPIIIDKKMTGIIIVFRDISIEKEVDRMKSEFVSLSSHQLRTPITSINWLTESILDDKTNQLIPRHRKIIEDIRSSNNRMTDLVNSLLNVARLEIGTFIIAPTTVKFHDICADALSDLKSLIIKKDITIKTKCDAHLNTYYADPHLLNIIIQNLLSNAIKYSNDGGTVTMKSEIKGDFLYISIKDNGIGIPEEQQEQIFTKLFRANNAQTVDTQGSGLGLYIVKLIVNSVGGKIWFKSKINIGSTFYITLPKNGMKRKEGTRSLI